MELNISKFEGVEDVLLDLNIVVRVDVIESPVNNINYVLGQQLYLNYGRDYSNVYFVELHEW
jgi:hypothetical protein